MTRWTIFFEPLDVLVVRDHRPFDAGHHFHAGSRFPLPSLVYGALRAALLLRAGADFRARDERFGLPSGLPALRLAGSRSGPGALTIAGPLLARWREGQVEPLFPWPRDLVVDGRQVSRLRPVATGEAVLCFRGDRRGEVVKHTGELPLGSGTGKPEKPPLLTLEGARRYARGAVGADFVAAGTCKEEAVYAVEPRTGIARDSGTGTVAESMIYGVEAWRFAAGCGLAVEVEVPDREAEAAIAGLDGTPVQVGGKGHRAALRVLRRPLLGGVEDAPTGGPVGAWFLSPGLLDPGALAGLEVRCAVGESVLLGGFDLARGRPRPLAPALARGTVLMAREAAGLRARVDALQRDRAEALGIPLRAGYGLYRLVQQPV